MSGTAAPPQRTPEERARVLALEIVNLLNPDTSVACAMAMEKIEPWLARALREAERAALWDVILHLSLELERKARPGGAVAALAAPETPD